MSVYDTEKARVAHKAWCNATEEFLKELVKASMRDPAAEAKKQLLLEELTRTKKEFDAIFRPK
jgi:hypothetical protein